MSAPSSELAVLFADVSGSTRLYETLGDERALAAVAHCLDAVSYTHLTLPTILLV